ncbi:MAG: magnesium transporter [Myxococcales bacterium]|nr:MAG: magnesium transporter [Myxococcales bacterium]
MSDHSSPSIAPELLRIEESSRLREYLDEIHPEDISDMLGYAETPQGLKILRLLPQSKGAEVLGRVKPELRDNFLEAIPPEESAVFLSRMSSDDRADFMQEIAPALAADLLKHLEEIAPEAAEDARRLIAYPEQSAGGLMTTEFIALAPDTKIKEAIEKVRDFSLRGHAETIYYIYVTAFGNKLVGVLSLRDLILADPENTLSDIMKQNVVRVEPFADQEEVAQTIARYDLSAIPITGPRGRLIGVVTVDDVVDVVIEEATEDAQKMAAIEPIDAAYFETSVATFIRKRAPWLVVLFIGELLTATVLKRYEHDFATTLILVAFIPLIISSGGNSGAQSSSLIIRALALGELEPKDWWRVFSKELTIGIALGLLLGIVGFARVFFVPGAAFTAEIALTVAGSIVAVVLLGALLGSLLPLGIKRLGLDPAVSSTPFIASLVDVLGLMLYFSIARVLIQTVAS